MSIFSQEKQSRLLELLSEEHAIFEQIREQTGKHAEILAADDIEALDEALDRRQELIVKINGLHQETDVLMQSYMAFSSAKGGSKIAAVEKAAERLKGIIAACAELNEKNVLAAKDMAEDYTKRIDKLSLSRKSLGAYVQAMPNNSELFDKKT